MTRKGSDKPQEIDARKERLKAALKANMQKRKAQAQARKGANKTEAE